MAEYSLLPFKFMKTRLLTALVLVLILITGLSGLAQGTTNQTAETELKALVFKIQAKLRDSKAENVTEADLANELKEFDALLAKHKDEKTDDVARILFMKATLYEEVFHESDKAEALDAQLQRDFPQTAPARMLKQQAQAEQTRKALVEGSKFPDFEEKDLAGKPLSVANYKGKVVLIDFWATWCGPCVGELPNVLKTYQNYHGKGFEIIGISLDQDKTKLKSFIADKNITWQQFFDGKGWENELAVKYGVNSIPATYLLDGEGKIIGKDLRGPSLDEAVNKALAGK